MLKECSAEFDVILFFVMHCKIGVCGFIWLYMLTMSQAEVSPSDRIEKVLQVNFTKMEPLSNDL
jgi:hypothetical protein